MRSIKLTFLFLAFVLISFREISETSEFIRRKVELVGNQITSVAGEPLYCLKSLPAFYQNNEYEMVWNNVEMLSQLIQAIESAYLEGLQPDDYHLKKLRQYQKEFNKISANERYNLELIATDAFLLYSSHLLSGKVDPINIDPEWHIVKREGDPVQMLSEAIKEKEVLQSLQNCLPKHETYNSLKSALKRYNSIANAGGWNKVDVGETIKFGAQGPRVLQVKNRLAASGDYQGELNNEVYDSTLFKAVTSFQTRYGLTADGEIGKGTVEAMNVSVVERVNQIKVNMERWRWLPKEFGDFYLMVNIADFKLEVVKAGKVERTHKVIVGKNFRRTPVFSSKMTYLVLCPTWTVPPGILRNDVLPAARKDIAIFEKKKLQIFDQSGNIVDPATVDWNDKVVNSFIYRQPAGADNALGDVKFMFPNNFSVYIHDTPTRDLFDKTERNFSSGCIRLHEPLKMAEYLLQGTDWTFEKIKKHVATATPLTIHLKEQPNVHILYWTAWTRDGIVQFRKDIYGRDPKLLESLMESNPTPVTD